MTLKLSAKRIFQSILNGIFVVLITLVGNSLTVTAVHAATGDGSPTDPNIKYIGRWDLSSSTLHTSYWPGAYLKTDFTGRTVKIKLAGSVKIYVTIDSGPDTFYSNVSGTVNLTPTPLAAGIHSLRVTAFSEHDDIQFQGLVLDAGAGAKTIAPTMPSQLIEFVGDSITAGATTTKHALSDYAWLIGERLSVEHTQIAQGGICLVDITTCGVKIGMSKQYFKMQTIYFPNSPAWNFSRYQANEVVINLGTNDNGYHVSDTAFQSTYITFLQNIRKEYPNARIFVIRPFKGAKAAYALAAVRAVNAAGDKAVEYIDTTGWITDADTNDGTHPSDAGHVKIANKLGPILAHYLGLSWKNS